MTIDLDTAALRAVTTDLAAAGRTYDDSGRDIPGEPDAGLATGLLADILFGFSESSARLVGTAVTLAETGEACNVEYQTTDSTVAEEFLLAAEETRE